MTKIFFDPLAALLLTFSKTLSVLAENAVFAAKNSLKTLLLASIMDSVAHLPEQVRRKLERTVIQTTKRQGYLKLF
jgi:hypothetical protein